MGFIPRLRVIGDWVSLFQGGRQKKSSRRSSGQVSVRRLRLEALEDRRVLAVVTVSNDLDVVNGDTDTISELMSNDGGDGISLREAIIAAAYSGDTVNFDASLNGATITLLLGEIAFSKNLVIDASMLTNGITIDANDPTPLNENPEDIGDGIRIFSIGDLLGLDPPEVTMKGLTLTGADPSPAAVPREGGAIQSLGFLTLEEMVIINNHAIGGAGVYVAVPILGGISGSRAVLTIINSTIANNVADSGGALSLRLSSSQNVSQPVEIIGSTLTGNTADRGGAIYFQSSSSQAGSSSVTITSSKLKENVATIEGGAIHMLESRVNLSILQESEISGNDALAGRGGGIFANMYYGQLEIENSMVHDNHADSVDVQVPANMRRGGGVFARLLQGASLSIVESEITGNTTSGDGGGIYAKAYQREGDPFSTPRAITISRSLISGNTALNRGGGLYASNEDGTETLVEYSRIMGNSVPVNEFGEYRNGGGIYSFLKGHNNLDPLLPPRFIISRSTVDNNHADNKGGGIFVCCKQVGHFIATNSTISGNETLDTTEGAGGGIVLARQVSEYGEVEADLRNVTITQNVSVGGGGLWTPDIDEIYLRIANTIISENFDLPEEDINRDSNNLNGRVVIGDFLYNLIGSNSAILDHETGDAETPGSTNKLNEDEPLLSDLGDFGGPTPTHHPLSGSPVIDMGSNDLAQDPLTEEPFEFDQRGMGWVRIYSTGDPEEPIVDIGAVEVQPAEEPCPPGDYNRDGIVNAADYVVWRDTLGSTVVPFDGADGNGDGEVTEPADYEVWSENFGAECEEPEELLVAASINAPVEEDFSKPAVGSPSVFVSLVGSRSNSARNGGPVRKTPTILNGSRVDETLLYQLFPSDSREQAWEQLGERRNRAWLEPDTPDEAQLAALDAAFGG